MLSHGYIKDNCDVYKWAAPEFLKQAAKELVQQSRQKVTGDKLPEALALLATTGRLG